MSENLMCDLEADVDSEKNEWGGEEWEWELMNSALVLSKRISDEEFEPLPYDLYDDADYSHPHTQTSVPDELQQLAMFFTQMMQMGQQQEISLNPDGQSNDDDHDEEEVDDDENNDAEKEYEEEASPCLPNAMHHAVFRCEVKTILMLLDEENKKNPQDFSDPLMPFQHSLDTPDHCGNTPLLLAVKLGYVELAKLLIAEGFQCDITSKHILLSNTSSSDSPTPCPSHFIREGAEFHLMDECVLLKSVPLIKAVYKELQRNTYSLWLQKKTKVLQTLLEIPDFYVELGWEFIGSGLMGPVVKMFAPYDTYRIWKRGNWLRLDSTIDTIQANNLKVERVLTSLIFQGSNSPGSALAGEEGELYILNRKERTYERMLRRFSDPSESELNHFAIQMIAAHSMNKGGFMQPKRNGDNGSSGGSGNQHMKVNSVDVDANNWAVKALTDRKGIPKTVRLAGEQRRDVYAEMTELDSDISSSVKTEKDTTTATAAAVPTSGESLTRPASISRLCYKWEASGHVKASLATKTSEEAHAFNQLSADDYFGAVWESAALDDAPSSSKSKWSSRLKGKKKEKKGPKTKEVKRKVEAAIFMVKDYPIALSELLPVLDIFAMKNEYLKKLVDIFNGNGNSVEKMSSTQRQAESTKSDAGDDSSSRSELTAPSFLNIPAELFPYRIQVPIILGISAMATFEHFERNPNIDPTLFAVDTQAYSELVDTISNV